MTCASRARRLEQRRDLEHLGQELQVAQPVLLGAEDRARAAQLQVLLGDLGNRPRSRSITRQPLARVLAAVAPHRPSARSRSARAPRPTRPRSWCSCDRPNRSACSTTITRRVGHVHADLDHGGGDQDLDLARARSACITASFSGALHAAVDHAHARARERPRAAAARRTPSAAFRSLFAVSSTSGTTT